jgi:PleD family two-component response regulator
MSVFTVKDFVPLEYTSTSSLYHLEQIAELKKKQENQSQLLRQKQRSDEAARQLQEEIQRIKTQKVIDSLHGLHPRHKFSIEHEGQLEMNRLLSMVPGLDFPATCCEMKMLYICLSCF